jgi:hypothetical protein
MALKDRQDLYTSQTVSGNTELDFLSSPLINYDFISYTLFVVPQYMIGRLDLVSYVNYGVPDFWWLIAQANDILDVFSDITAGQTLKIPNLSEYYNFYNTNVGV